MQAKYSGSGSISSAMKLHWYVAATGAEVANATNLSGETVRLMILGG